MENKESYQLYYFTSCVFCLRTRMQLKLMGIELPLKNIKRNREHRNELLEGGGKVKVPCLRIEDEAHGVRWLYESSSIIKYFRNRID